MSRVAVYSGPYRRNLHGLGQDDFSSFDSFGGGYSDPAFGMNSGEGVLSLPGDSAPPIFSGSSGIDFGSPAPTGGGTLILPGASNVPIFGGQSNAGTGDIIGAGGDTLAAGIPGGTSSGWTSSGSTVNVPSGLFSSIASALKPSPTVAVPLAANTAGMYLANRSLLPGLPNWAIFAAVGAIALLAMTGGRRR